MQPLFFHLAAVKVTQPYRVLSTNGTAQIQCVIHPRPAFHQIQPSHEHLRYPYPDPVDLRVALLKGLHGNQKLCSSKLNFSEQNEAQQQREGEVRELMDVGFKRDLICFYIFFQQCLNLMLEVNICKRNYFDPNTYKN